MASEYAFPEDMQKWIDDNIRLSNADFMQAFNAQFKVHDMPVELLRTIDSYKCGRENSGPHRLPARYYSREYEVGAIHIVIDDSGTYAIIVTSAGMYTYDYEVVVTPAQYEWAMDTLHRTRLRGSHAFDDFVRNFGVPQSHAARGILDIIVRGDCLEDDFSMYFTHERVIDPYERELYPGEPGTVLRLPASRGGTWYVVDPHRVGVFTCHVKHFSTEDDAAQEVSRIREEEEREAEAEAREEERYWNEPARGGYHDDEDDERRLCGCDDPSQVVPSCGGCVCGCRRGCTVSRCHNAHCEFNDPGEED